MSFWGYVLLFHLVVVYWIASLGAVCLRGNQTFQRLTWYGGRHVLAAETTADEEGEDTTLKFSGGKRTSRARPSMAVTTRNGLQKLLRVLSRSTLGKQLIRRQWAFCGFYLVGLLTCLYLLWHFPATPCQESAEASVRARFGVPPKDAHNAQIAEMLQKSLRYGRRSSPQVEWDANMEKRFQDKWKAFLPTRPWLTNTPFVDFRNCTRIELAQELYKEQVRLCESHVAPLLWWERIPLVLFAVHCFIRLLESAGVQSYAEGKKDSVTLFAFFSGCSFYVMAAISSDLSCLASLRQEELRRSFREASLLPSPLTESSPTAFGNVSLFSDYMNEATQRAVDDHYQRFEKYGGVLGVFASVVRLGPVIVPRTILVILVLLHVGLQWIQVYHHEILACQRRGPEAKRRLKERMTLAQEVRIRLRSSNLGQTVAAKRDSNDRRLLLLKKGVDQVTEEMRSGSSPGAAGEAVADEVHKKLYEAVYDDKVWEYRYPYKALFQIVLEPHYLCEVLLYVVQLVTIGVILFYNVFAPAARMKHSRLLGWFDVFAPGHAAPSITLVTVVISQLGAALGVLFFSLLNLCFTAEEHREFWVSLSEKRIRIKEFVLENVIALEDVEDVEDVKGSEASKAFWENPHSERFSRERALQESKKQERKVMRRRTHRQLFALTDPELIPVYNLVPLVW